MTQVVYGDDRDGGPERAYDLAGIYVIKVRRRLEPIGWTITRSRTKPRLGHRLIQLGSQQ